MEAQQRLGFGKLRSQGMKRSGYYSTAIWMGVFIVIYGGIKTHADPATDRCAREAEANARAAIKATSGAMDKVARYLEEYGTISLSSPLFVEPGTNFTFDLHRGATNYFSEAKTQIEGAVATSRQTATAIGLAAEAQYDPTLVGQYGALMTDYMKQRGAQEMKNSLIVSAAEKQFQADLLRANQETNTMLRDQLLSSAYSNYAVAYPVSTNATKFPTSADVNSSLPGFSTNAAGRASVRDVFSNSNFLGPGALISGVLTGNPPTINNRMALNIAAGDVATESIMNMLLNPSDAGKFSNKKVFFGVTMVSINPGWRTQSKSYVGDLTADTQITYRPAGRLLVERFLGNPPEDLSAEFVAKIAADAGLSYKVFASLFKRADMTEVDETKFNLLAGANTVPLPPVWELSANNTPEPMVIAVTPNMDVEVLDLASSYRRQFELTLKLAAAMQMAGMKGAANAFLDHASRLEQDARTRTPIPIINSYSISGKMFGFQIGPRLQALGSPANKKSGPEEILHRQSFPAILIVGLNSNAFRLLIERQVGADAKVRYVLNEPHLRIVPSVRWLRMNTGFLGLRGRQDEEDYIKLSESLSGKLESLNNCVAQLPKDKNWPADITSGYALATNRSAMFRALAFVVASAQTFSSELLVPKNQAPPEAKKAPIAGTVEPKTINLSRDAAGAIVAQPSLFMISGAALTQIDKDHITALPAKADGITAKLQTDQLIVLEANVKDTADSLVFQMPIQGVAGGGSPGNLYTMPITITAAPKPPGPTLDQVFEQTTSSTTPDGKTTTTTLGIKVLPNTDTNLFHLLQSTPVQPSKRDSSRRKGS